MVGFSICFENGVDRLVGVWERERSKMTPGFSAQGIRSMGVAIFRDGENYRNRCVRGGRSPVSYTQSVRCLSDIQAEC